MWLERFCNPCMYIQTSFPISHGLRKGFKNYSVATFISLSSTMLLFHSSNWGSDYSVLHMGNSWQHVPQKSLQSTGCYPRPSKKLLQLTQLTSLTIALRCSWPETCQAVVPPPPCPEPRPGVPHMPKIEKWINMDLWGNCGPILSSEAHLIMLLARYFSLRHT